MVCMEFIPVIYFNKRKIQTSLDENDILLDDFLNKSFDEKQIYILDSDGIKKDKPNLCSYPKLAEKYETWIDSMPMTVGDVVHLVTAGANLIIIRENLWKKKKVSEIQELTENKIFAEVDITTLDEFEIGVDLFDGVDGIVIFNNKQQIESDFKYGRILNVLCKTHPVYVYEFDKNNCSYWKKKGVGGLLVELENIKEFKNEF